MVIMDIFIILRGEDKSMSKKGRNLVLNRKDYERIRRMDYCQMTLWVESVYKSGFKDGKAAASKGALTIDQVREILIGVNGFEFLHGLLACLLVVAQKAHLRAISQKLLHCTKADAAAAA